MIFMEVFYPYKKLKFFKFILGTSRFFKTICVEKHQKQFSFVDLTNLDNLRNGIKSNTKVNFYFILKASFFLRWFGLKRHQILCLKL